MPGLRGHTARLISTGHTKAIDIDKPWSFVVCMLRMHRKACLDIPSEDNHYGFKEINRSFIVVILLAPSVNRMGVLRR